MRHGAKHPPQKKFCLSEAKPVVKVCKSGQITSPPGERAAAGASCPQLPGARGPGKRPRSAPMPTICLSPAGSPPRPPRPLPRAESPGGGCGVGAVGGGAVGGGAASWDANLRGSIARLGGPAEMSVLPSSSRRRVNCQGCRGETYSFLTIFNLKMQMLLASRSLIRAPLCHALTSIRGDYEHASTLAFPKCHCDSTCCTNAWLSR